MKFFRDLVKKVKKNKTVMEEDKKPIMAEEQRKDKVTVIYRPHTQANMMTAEAAIYHQKRIFKPDSPLFKYLVKNAPTYFKNQTLDTALYEIMICLKRIISEKKLYDPDNPAIIILNEDLTEALGTARLHVSEVREQVIDQLITPPDQTIIYVSDKPTIQPVQPAQAIQMAIPPQTNNLVIPCWANRNARVYEVMRNTNPNFNIRGFYIPSKELLEVMRELPTTSMRQSIFHYPDITGKISKFIMENKHILMDLTNIRIIKISETKMGKCFKVSYLHRNQITAFIRHELTPITDPVAISNEFNALIPPDMLVWERNIFIDIIQNKEEEYKKRILNFVKQETTQNPEARATLISRIRKIFKKLSKCNQN